MPAAHQEHCVHAAGGCSGAVAGTMLLGPILGIAGAGILGGLWGRGLLSDMAWWASLFLLGVGAIVLDLLARRRPRPVEVSPEASARPKEKEEVEGDGAASSLLDGRGAALAALLSDVKMALIVTDAGGAVLYASDMATALLERGDEEEWAALRPSGTFFGLPVEDAHQLGTLHQFFSSECESGDGVVTIAGTRRQLYWAGRVLGGTEGLGLGRLFIMRDVTAERRFEVLKNDFLATVSHELRTPLTSLRGSLQLVVSRAEGLQPMDVQLLEIGIKNAERLIRIINDLLDIDSLEQGSIAFQFTTLELSDLVRAALEAAAESFDERGVRVVVEMPDEMPTIHGDRGRLMQVLVNLLNNASKYAPSGSTVTVRASARDGGLQVDVCDQGPGISAAEQPHVFERFWRADRMSADAGAGLGLAICRAVIARHGGQIWLESAEGEGATFSFFLPRSIFRLESDRAVERSSEGAGGCILLVEDDADARAVLRTSLERHGYEIVEVSTGARGVAMARSQRPAAVVLDVLLPDINGYDVLRILKNSPDTATIPVLVLSVEPERELARRLGAADVLQKPLDFEAVRWSLAQALRRVGRPDGSLVLAMGPAVSRELAMLATALTPDGHKVYRALDIEDLGRWTASSYPDIIVLDDDFLQQSRAEAVELLQQPVTEHCIPILFLTSKSGDQDAGPGWTCVQKPISKDEFVQAAGRLLVEAAEGWRRRAKE